MDKVFQTDAFQTSAFQAEPWSQVDVPTAVWASVTAPTDVWIQCAPAVGPTGAAYGLGEGPLGEGLLGGSGGGVTGWTQVDPAT